MQLFYLHSTSPIRNSGTRYEVVDERFSGDGVCAIVTAGGFSLPCRRFSRCAGAQLVAKMQLDGWDRRGSWSVALGRGVCRFELMWVGVYGLVWTTIPSHG